MNTLGISTFDVGEVLSSFMRRKRHFDDRLGYKKKGCPWEIEPKRRIISNKKGLCRLGEGKLSKKKSFH